MAFLADSGLLAAEASTPAFIFALREATSGGPWSLNHTGLAPPEPGLPVWKSPVVPG